jgi:hypothetical protein
VSRVFFLNIEIYPRSNSLFGEEIIDYLTYKGNTNMRTGEIQYSPEAFTKNYDFLKATTFKEGFPHLPISMIHPNKKG